MEIMGFTCSGTDYLFSWLPGHVMYGTDAAIGSIALINLSPFLPLSYNERNTMIYMDTQHILNIVILNKKHYKEK